jgi:hypothetical protein
VIPVRSMQKRAWCLGDANTRTVLAQGGRQKSGDARLDFSVQGTEVDIRRIPSFRSPTAVTIPPKKGLVLTEVQPKPPVLPVKGGGRSAGTVEVAVAVVGDDLSSLDDAVSQEGSALESGMVVDVKVSPLLGPKSPPITGPPTLDIPPPPSQSRFYVSSTLPVVMGNVGEL